MFCPKCGTQNPDNGKFCRACGTDLGNVSAALTGNSSGFEQLEQIQSWKKKRKPISYETAITKMFTGLGFLVLATVLAVTKVAGGQFWWFWLLIPAFGALGSGIAQYVQLKKTEQQQNSQNSLNYSSHNQRLLSPEEAVGAIQNQLQTGNKIEAIKIHREVYGSNLKEAKEAIERIESERSSFSYYNSPPQGSIYDTGELAAPPPSVTENTTRHLEINKDGETMTLPKK
jgi:zinc-ribbon domain